MASALTTLFVCVPSEEMKERSPRALCSEAEEHPATKPPSTLERSRPAPCDEAPRAPCSRRRPAPCSEAPEHPAAEGAQHPAAKPPSTLEGKPPLSCLAFRVGEHRPDGIAGHGAAAGVR